MKPIKKLKIKLHDPKKFLVRDKSKYRRRTYEFPFEALDQKKGLGIIEWNLELFSEYDRSSKKYYINKMWIWAGQTMDKRYRGKIFQIECYTEAIKALPFTMKNNEDAFIQRVWSMKYWDNGNLVMTAYPKHEHNILQIETFSSIFLEPKFLTRRGR